MLQREDFVRLVHQRRRSVTELCIAFGISEKTGHKWLARFAKEGVSGLLDRSHVPHSPPHQLAAEVRRAVIRLREHHPTWGARKLRAALAAKSADVNWPAASTIGELLKREGLSRDRRRRRASGEFGLPLDGRLTFPSAVNEVWTTDFKGEFRLAAGPYCFPLTVMDAKSRFLLGCTGLLSTSSAPVKTAFTKLFQRYGLPDVIRSDNGVPFASASSICRLSTLSVWWIRLGIRPERIKPGHPQQNGRHERFHKTLKAEAIRPASNTLEKQQHRFDRFRREYNTDRPHEALAQRPPVSCYEPSMRPFPQHLAPVEYPSDVEVRRVAHHGIFRWKGRGIWLSKALAGEDIGLEESDADIWTISFGSLILGSYHEPSNTFVQESYWKHAPHLET